MQTKVVVCALGIVSLFAVAARGQETSTKFDVFAGYSYVRANPSDSTDLHSFNMNGGEASLAYNLKSWLSGVADFSGYRVSRSVTVLPFVCVVSGCPDVQGNMSTYLFGPRVSYRHFRRVTPFAQALFGTAHATSGVLFSGSDQTHFAMTVGGGFDYRLSRHFSVRPVQAEYLLTRLNEFAVSHVSTQNNVRLSTGIMFHF